MELYKMDVKIYIAERLKSENSTISSLDEKNMPIEHTTVKQMYKDGWRLKTISPVAEEDPFRTYLVFEKETSF